MRWFMSTTIGEGANCIITQGHAFGMFRCNRQCFNASPNMPKACPYAMAFCVRFPLLPTNNSLFHQGFFAVKRRAIFILGAKWKALVIGWRRDCVVGGMETRFQWRKAHSRTARCEAFHFAPRLFFMFLFLIPSTIRQQCIIYLQEFSTEP